MLVPGDMLLDVYSCAERPDAWRHVLDRVCGELGARSAIIQLLDRRGLRNHERWTARDTRSSADAEVHDALVNNESNPRLDLTVASPLTEGSVLRDRERFEPGCRHLARLKERTAAIGLGEALGVGVDISEKRKFVLLLHRAADDPRDFSPRDEQFLRELAPHLKQAAHLAGTIAQAQDRSEALAQVVDRLRVGVMLVDRGRHIAWTNASADRILGRSPHIFAAGGGLRCAASADEFALSRLIDGWTSEARVGAGRAALTIGFHHADRLQIMVVPVAVAGAGNKPGLVALLLTEPGIAPLLSAAAIGPLIGLSPAEARLAVALCDGLTVNEYAERRGITVGTARIQLKQALAKTGTRRQAELVMRVCGSVLAQAIEAAEPARPKNLRAYTI